AAPLVAQKTKNPWISTVLSPISLLSCNIKMILVVNFAFNTLVFIFYALLVVAFKEADKVSNFKEEYNFKEE
ncbi:MAG: hypothetical protein ACRDEA_14865, partial [Microcystaceae cyanobacterium]